MSAEKTTEQSKEWVRWVDKSLQVTLEVPARWEAFENPRVEFLLQAPGPENERPTLAVQKIEVPFPDRSVQDNIERETLAGLQANKDYHLLEQKTLTLDELFTANLYRMGWTNSANFRVVQWLMLVSGGRSLFLLMLTSPASRAESLLPEVERIFSSVHFRFKGLVQTNAARAGEGSDAGATLPTN